MVHSRRQSLPQRLIWGAEVSSAFNKLESQCGQQETLPVQLPACTECRCQGLSSRRGCWGGPSEKGYGLVLCWTQPLRAGSDRPNAGQSSAHQWHWRCLCADVFKKGLKPLHSSCEGGVRTHERNCPADTQVREKEQGGGAAGAREEIPPTARADIHPHCSPSRTFSRTSCIKQKSAENKKKGRREYRQGPVAISNQVKAVKTIKVL